MMEHDQLGSGQEGAPEVTEMTVGLESDVMAEGTELTEAEKRAFLLAVARLAREARQAQVHGDLAALEPVREARLRARSA